MTAAYRLKGIGWFAVLVAFALGFYLVSLRVAAERKRLDDVNARIAIAERDIRALETEFDTRANFVQLERWNGDTLSLAAPTAAQFVADAGALAALDPLAAPLPTARLAALVVPAHAAPFVAAPAAMPVQLPAATLAAEPAITPVITPAVARTVAPVGRTAPAIAQLAEAARGAVAVARVRPQAVALLDRQLLSSTTFGDLASGARREARR